MCRMATIVPMKPRAAEQIPTEDQILISSNQSFVNSKKKNRRPETISKQGLDNIKRKHL